MAKQTMLKQGFDLDLNALFSFFIFEDSKSKVFLDQTNEKSKSRGRECKKSGGEMRRAYVLFGCFRLYTQSSEITQCPFFSCLLHPFHLGETGHRTASTERERKENC